MSITHAGTSWRWAGGEPARCPVEALAGARGSTVLRLEGSRCGTLDGSGALLAWSRSCALAVAHLWPCPQIVRRWLEHGDGRLRERAWYEIVVLEPESFRADAARAAKEVLWNAEAIWLVAGSVAESARAASEGAVRATGAGDEAGRDARKDLRRAQSRHLASLLEAQHQLLQMAPALWPLAHGDRQARTVLRDHALQRRDHALVWALDTRQHACLRAGPSPPEPRSGERV